MLSAASRCVWCGAGAGRMVGTVQHVEGAMRAQINHRLERASAIAGRRSGMLAYAISEARATGRPLADCHPELRTDVDADIIAEGEKILALLATADENHPDAVPEFERLVQERLAP